MTAIVQVDQDPTVGLRTAGGHTAHFAVRQDTNDAALVHGIIGGAEYPFATMQGLSGWAIDVGAHIGIVSVALALDNPDLRIVAVEALPENAAMLRRNVLLNGLSERVFIEEAAASDEMEYKAEATIPIVYGWSKAQNQPDHYMQESRFIGGMVGPNDTSKTALCPALSLSGIRAKYAMGRITLVKSDAEGAEWYFFRSPDIKYIDRIVGELHHGKNGGAKEFRALLKGFKVEMDDSLVVAVFEAVR